MIAALRPHSRRITIAIALSALMHAAILWLPHFHLAQEKLNLPPLTARLEPLPLPAGKPAAKSEPPNLLSKPGEGPSTEKVSGPAKTMQEMEKSAATHQFPKHLQLTFTVSSGADLSNSGELIHRLDIDADKYTLEASKTIGGLKNLLIQEQTIQNSHGKIDEHGLQPTIFKEDKISGGKKQELQTTFDWATQIVHLSTGEDAPLPADLQDILSFMYQLSQLSMRREIVPLTISDGTRLEQIQIEIGTVEDIITPMGNLRALHLRKIHVQGEPYFEIWLAKEYRLLPVKFRQINALGKVIEEFSISDIRASDE